MRRTTWPAPTSVHDLQPGQRSLRLKGVKSGPLSGVRDLLPPFTPLYGVLATPGFSAHPYPGFGTCGPPHSPLYGVFGDPFRGLSSHPYPGFGTLVPGTLAPSSHPYAGFLRPFQGLSSHPYPGFGTLVPGTLAPSSHPYAGFCDPFRGLSLSPLFGVLLRHDEVVREPDILTGPAGLDVVVVEHFNYVSLPLMMPMPSLPFVTLLSQSLTEICPTPHRRDRKASR